MQSRLSFVFTTVAVAAGLFLSGCSGGLDPVYRQTITGIEVKLPENVGSAARVKSDFVEMLNVANRQTVSAMVKEEFNKAIDGSGRFLVARNGAGSHELRIVELSYGLSGGKGTLLGAALRVTLHLVDSSGKVVWRSTEETSSAGTFSKAEAQANPELYMQALQTAAIKAATQSVYRF